MLLIHEPLPQLDDLLIQLHIDDQEFIRRLKFEQDRDAALFAQRDASVLLLVVVVAGGRHTYSRK
jgi:hypothetical protein